LDHLNYKAEVTRESKISHLGIIALTRPQDQIKDRLYLNKALVQQNMSGNGAALMTSSGQNHPDQDYL